MKRTLYSTSLALLAMASGASAQIVYVDDDAPAGGDGSSWGQAFQRMEDGLAALSSGDQLWVAAGDYYVAPPGGARTATFQIPGFVEIYGGFDGSENSLAERAGLFTQTVLSGDIERDSASGNIVDDAYHVVTMFDVQGTTFDGFTIERGNADLTAPIPDGGGIFADETDEGLFECVLQNLTVQLNRAARSGAGVYISRFGNSVLRDSSVQLNVAFSSGVDGIQGYGGGIYLVEVGASDGPGAIANVHVLQNRARQGGGLFTEAPNQDLEITNSLFTFNTAEAGGGMFIDHGSASIYMTNCTIARNQTYTRPTTPVNPISGGGGIFFDDVHSGGDGLKEINNSIVYENNSLVGTVNSVDSINGPGATLPLLGGTAVRAQYSCVEFDFLQTGGVTPVWFQTGSIGANPQFVGSGSGVYTLNAGSPCLDAGNDGLLRTDIWDLDGDMMVGDLVSVDFLGAPREQDDPATDTGVDAGGEVAGAIVDMGAFER